MGRNRAPHYCARHVRSMVTSFSQSLGTVAAGLLGTFPCMLTSLLIVTSLEEDVKSAGKLAQSFPLGQLATLSFVIVFGQLCHSVGVLPALVAGYATALATLVAIEGISQTLCRPDFFAHPNRDDRVVPLGTSGEILLSPIVIDPARQFASIR